MSDVIINPLRDSSLGYMAVTYALYKVATPIRYTITLGGTTLTINYLQKTGYIRTVPSATKLREMYQEKKEDLLNRKDTRALGGTMKLSPTDDLAKDAMLKSLSRAIGEKQKNRKV